jgi:3-oxoacyl-[acyl-carrier protein] reductase
MSTETVLISGASADIGLALMARLRERPNLRVIAHCHAGRERLTALCDELAERAMIVAADLATEAGCGALMRAVDDAAWRPTHFVHLPALPLVYERFARFDWPRVQRDLEIQVGSLVRLLRHWLPRAGEDAVLKSVVVVSSSVTQNAPPKFLSMYTTVKYAQLGLVRSLAAEYSERGVAINLVSPSMVETRFLSGIPQKTVELNAAANPLRRNATADEVAKLVEWIAMSSSFMSGTNVPLTGGA